MNKKGVVIELQFNWIFVLIVSALTLVLTVGIIAAISRSSNEKLANVAVNYFKEIFANIQKSTNREYKLSLEGLSLSVDSEKDFCSKFSVKGSSLEGESIASIPFFSPASINEELLSYSLSWNIPFRANYFLYATGPDVAYVFVTAGGDETSVLFDNSPKGISKIKVQAGAGFVNSNFKSIRFISNSDISVIDQSVSRLNDKQVSFIKIESAANKVKYHIKSGNVFALEAESYYFDTPSLLAAIYSDNAGSYECNMLKAVKRLGYEAQIVKARIAPIIAGYYDKCNSLEQKYHDAEALLDEITPLTVGADSLSASLVSELRAKSDALSAINNDINELGCPTIY
ncbi:MAG: hypothetical protein V1859_01520 [archaeon]